MLKDTIYIFQFQDPQEQQPSNFAWSLDMDEVDKNSKCLGYPDESPLKEQSLFMDILNDERDETFKILNNEKNKEKLGKEMEFIDIKVQDKKEEYTERDVRFKFLTLPFAKRKKIGEEMIPRSFEGNNLGEVERSIAFLIDIKNMNRYRELWNELNK
jgi:hypothetical protein